MRQIGAEIAIGSCRLINADCRDILPTLAQSAVIVTDPPYGISYRVNARAWSNEGLKTTKRWSMDASEPIEGDDVPFDAAHLLPYRKVAIFGGNYMQGLPAGGRWIVWDKRRDSKPDDHSDAELIWTNVPGVIRIHRQKWRGIVREGEENASRSRKLHPNQKPVGLINEIFDLLGVEPDALIVDPYMGSGSTGVAALRRGHPFVGIESDSKHFATAVSRIRAEAAE